MAYAAFEDVQARYHLPIEDDLRDLVLIRLEDAEDLIRERMPDLDEKIDEGTVSEKTVVRVTAEAVIRLVRNPDGYVSETDGSYTYQLAEGSGGADLFLTDRDWRALGVRRKVRVIHPSPELPSEGLI